MIYHSVFGIWKKMDGIWQFESPCSENPIISSLTPRRGLTITPIAKVYKKTNAGPDSKRDYDEQCRRTSSLLDGDQWCWDDHRHHNTNPTKVGDYFAFQFYGECIIFHKVLQICNPMERLASWTLNVGQCDRPVLMLSRPLFTISWKDWISDAIGGAKKTLGTYKVNWTRLKGENRIRKITLYNHINTEFRWVNDTPLMTTPHDNPS